MRRELQAIKPSQRIAARQQLPQSRRDQYDLLVPYYKEEAERYEALNKRAAAYLSILGAVSAFAVFKADAVSQHIFSHKLPLFLAALTLLAVLACVLTVAYAVRIAEYKTPIGPKEFVLRVDQNRYTSEDSYSIMLAGLVDSIETNRSQNDRCADALQISLWFGAGAIVLFIALNASLLFIIHKDNTMTSSKGPGTSTSSQQAPASAPSSSPSKTPMADLLNTSNTVPAKKSDDSPRESPARKVK
jgi:hypothetical protein